MCVSSEKHTEGVHQNYSFFMLFPSYLYNIIHKIILYGSPSEKSNGISIKSMFIYVRGCSCRGVCNIVVLKLKEINYNTSPSTLTQRYTAHYTVSTNTQNTLPPNLGAGAKAELIFTCIIKLKWLNGGLRDSRGTETYECKVDIRVIGEGCLDAYQMLPAFYRYAKMYAYVMCGYSTQIAYVVIEYYGNMWVIWMTYAR